MIRVVNFLFLFFIIVSCKNENSSEANSPTSQTPSESISTHDTIKDLLRVTNPAEDQLVTSPLEITGEARGYWFFEATASVELLDGNMDLITEKFITSTAEWMTEDWVPFSGTINFEDPSTETGFLILHKANASGLEDRAMSDTIPIKFRR